jgi:uncharacterized membrane protein (UPF0127 family)
MELDTMKTNKAPRLYVELANTPATLEAGLMYRDKLAKNAGMLFEFPSSRRLSFWMKNTPIPLDIAFVSDDGVIVDIKDLAPMSMKSVQSSTSCKYALEVNSGWFAENGISEGDRIFGSFSKKAQSEGEEQQQVPSTPDVVLTTNFKEAIRTANQRKLAVVFSYEYPEGNVKKYQLVPLEEYLVRPGKTDGDLVTATCIHSDGGFRSFIIANILDFELYETQGEHRGRRVDIPIPVPHANMPEEGLEKVPQEGVFPPEVGEQAVAAFNALDDVKKEADGGYSGGGQLMMGPYWRYLKKQRGKGLSEGEAVLKYLDENSKKNTKKKKKKSKPKKRK